MAQQKLYLPMIIDALYGKKSLAEINIKNVYLIDETKSL